MNKSKKWQILNTLRKQSEELTIEELIELLLQNREIISKKDKEAFLYPKLESVTPDSVGINKKNLRKASSRIGKAIKNKERIIIFGDYDVDGITGTAILWESLFGIGANVMPYIPHRVGEGYGLSVKGIENVLKEYPDTKLVITVDNGIVANEAVKFAKEKKLDVIITDHHTVGETLPDAFAIIHTTKLCGAGVAWILSKELQISNDRHSKLACTECNECVSESQKTGSRIKLQFPSDQESGMTIPKDHLALVALATVADLVPLTGDNRTLLVYGLKELQKTTRPGIVALCNVAQLAQQNIDVYAIGHMLGPRLNAMGRMESAMESLRLLCTKDRLKAKVLADTLDTTNRERQLLTKSLAEHAIAHFKDTDVDEKKLLFISDDSYEEGVIGLVAGKLVEEYYRPAIVLSKGEKYSKASARSITGFNIIELIRKGNHLLINAGGHPMAAGFTIETEKIPQFQKAVEDLATELLDGDTLTRVVKVDCELPIQYVSQEIYNGVQQLSPFGMGNPEPCFVSYGVKVADVKTVGKEGTHLKLVLSSSQKGESRSQSHPRGVDQTSSKLTSGMSLSAIGFNLGDMASKIKVGDCIDIVYTIDENVWQDKKSLQLKIRDIHTK